MKDNLLIGFGAGVLIVPVCAACILGPAFVASLAAGAFGWFTGLGPAVTIGLGFIAAILVYGLARRRWRHWNRFGPMEVDSICRLPPPPPA